MNIIETTLTTTAYFSDDGEKRYLLEKVWDKSKPSLAVIMMCPSYASSVSMDSTTLLCCNNADRLDFGSMGIVNLFARLNDFDIKDAEAEDAENLLTIVECAKKADTILYCPGVGKNRNKTFLARQKQVLVALQSMEDKLYCLCDENGHARLQHPLSPSVRKWYLSKLSVNELIEDPGNEAMSKKETIAKSKEAPCDDEVAEKKRRGRKPKATTTDEIVPNSNETGK